MPTRPTRRSAPDPRGTYQPGPLGMLQLAALHAWDGVHRCEPWLSIAAIGAVVALAGWLFVALGDDSRGKPAPGDGGGRILLDNVSRQLTSLSGFSVNIRLRGSLTWVRLSTRRTPAGEAHAPPPDRPVADTQPAGLRVRVLLGSGKEA